MANDDEILEAYEHEMVLAPPGPPPGRKAWIVFAAFAVACAFVLVEIFANLGIKDSIAHAQFSLSRAQQAAEAIEERGGAFTAADPAGLAEAVPDLRFVGPDVASGALDEISVAAGVSEWAAAVQARPGACFYVHIEAGEVTYGTGTVCTGRQGLLAQDFRW